MTRAFLLLVLAVCTVHGVRADGVIVIRLSCKAILAPLSGAPPEDFQESDITNAVETMNTLMDAYGRGYRFVLVDPITRVGERGGHSRPNPSHYYGINMVAQPDERLNMESDALENPELYDWNFSAINIYINTANSGLMCGFQNSQVIVIGGGDANRAAVHLHELGHFFGLCHTQGCSNGCCDGSGPGSDGLDDTIVDLPCWDRDEIAQHNFGENYNQLSSDEQNDVDNVLFNVMSYHSALQNCGMNNTSFAGRLTEHQLDRWSDTASVARFDVCDGRTFFVLANAGGSQTGRSTNPFDRVAEGIDAADPAGGDIVMIRSGAYPENLTINIPVTLRAPRGHIARIGG